MKLNSFSPLPEEDDEELHLPELIYWASLGELEQVKNLLIQDIDVNMTDDEGYSALHAAAENNHLMLVQLLIQHGANHAHKAPYSALELAEMAGNTSIIDYLKSLS
ncbi:hypothetical protein B9T31_06610 [Acinetobacter sp. ANC 4558]|uniref:ankyrin repeat domain-containing protein n=1 Tax=Acinetobacter sp. ANC 4558 TaxID=1977876 RepID=UPI000A33B16E|nr:ankyrin repeat domain-containing protein [Acinetobacter sp. ANC 4558]OTG86669.1 hypothetical protein B9T31_06610 [Acinetobacter sp. ANC 4558]